jgi:hypothetical protein
MRSGPRLNWPSVSGPFSRAFSKATTGKESKLNSIILKMQKRINESHVQMLSPHLYNSVFPEGSTKNSASKSNTLLQASKLHLSKNQNNPSSQNESALMADFTGEMIELPKLTGKTIRHHFLNIGNFYTKSIMDKISIALKQFPSTRKEYYFPSGDQILLQSGWIKYISPGNSVYVSHPDGDVVFFDVEISPKTS